MKKITLTLTLFIIIVLTGCSNDKNVVNKGKSIIDGNDLNLKNSRASYYKEYEGSTVVSKNNKFENSYDYIIPNSDKKVITTETLDKLEKSKINYARNEIYARHGYIFKSKKYKEYFKSKLWYHEKPNFSEKDFSEIEIKNIQIINNYVNLMDVIEVSNNYGKYDLDKDGIMDKVMLLFQENSTKYTLNVNDASISQKGSNFKNSMFLYDLNTNDNYLEIAVVDEGTNNDPETDFYYYDGSTIIYIGKIPGDNESIKVTGNSTLSTLKKSNLLSDFYYKVTYNLTDTRALVSKKTKSYEINTQVKLKESLIAQIDKSDEKNTLTLNKGEIITLLSSDDTNWCYVSNSEGKCAWLKINSENTINEKKISDIFENLKVAASPIATPK
jgi:hypothetical protein